MRITNVTVVMLLMLMIVSCNQGPTANETLKRYETYQMLLTPSSNKAGFGIEPGQTTISIKFDNPTLNTNGEYLNIMAGRIYVADAENPGEPLPVRIGSQTTTVTRVDGTRTVTNGLSVWLDEKIKTKFFLVGFKGIDKSESEALETPPLFFLVDRKAGTNLTPVVLQAGNLIAADYEKTRFPVYTATLNHKIDILGSQTKTYTIRIGTIGKDDNGYTYVDYLSEDINERDWIITDGSIGYRIESSGLYTRLISPLFTEIKAGKKKILSRGYAIESGVGMREFYDTKELPDTLFVWSKEMNGLVIQFGEKIVFDGKTKEVVKK